MTDRQKILIVDDKEQNLYALEKVLEDVDADTFRATSGNDALIAQLHHDFALAILDVQMPGMDGYELAGLMRYDEKTRNLPVIFLTAVYSDEHHMFKGYEAGAVDFMTKPYRPEVLLAKVRIFLQLDYQKLELKKSVEIEKTKNHLENILLSMTDAVLVVSKNGSIQSANEAALALAGYSHDEIVGMSFSKLTGEPGSALEQDLLFADPIEDTAAFTREKTLYTKQGDPIPVLISESAFHDRENLLLGTVIVAKDIRGRIKAQKALQASEERYRTLYETSRDGIAFFDMNSTLSDANQAFLNMVGYKLSELRGVSHLEIIPPKLHDMEARILNEQVVPRGYSNEHELEYIRRDGSVFPVSARVWLSRDEDGNPAGMWMIVRDMTEYKLLERQRIMTEKMTALGMIAGGMAHELNNPMMGIHGFIEYCLKHTQKEDRRYEILDDARRETKRCMDLVQSLLTFSHVEEVSEETCQSVDCGALFDRVLRLLAYRIEKEGVQMIKQVSANNRSIYAKENAMQQVFLNLMTNALDAVAQSPEKEIRIEARPAEEYVKILISDTGKGILPEHLDRIFDPFFTTKPVGKGTGLGLSVSKSIVESHGGRLQCRSAPGKGTRFELQIPGKKDKHFEKEV